LLFQSNNKANVPGSEKTNVHHAMDGQVMKHNTNPKRGGGVKAKTQGRNIKADMEKEGWTHGRETSPCNEQGTGIHNAHVKIRGLITTRVRPKSTSSGEHLILGQGNQQALQTCKHDRR